MKTRNQKALVVETARILLVLELLIKEKLEPIRRIVALYNVLRHKSSVMLIFIYIRASKASLVNIGFMVVLAWILGSFHSINRMDP